MSPGSLAPLEYDSRLAHHFGVVIYCMSLLGIALAVGIAIRETLQVQNVLLVFLPVILLAAVKFGFWTASWASVMSVLATSFFFAEPRYSFAVADPGNVWALAVFLVAAALTSSVAAKARQRADVVSYHNRILEQLVKLASQLSGHSRRAEVIGEFVRHIEELLAVDVVFLEPVEGDVSQVLRVSESAPAGIELTPAERSAAGECADTRAAIVSGVGERQRSGWEFYPIQIADLAVAVLGVRPRNLESWRSQSGVRLFELLLEQIEVNLERVRLSEEIQRADMIAETEKLRTALLTSISHDLRTPLASILGNVTSVRRYGQLYDEETRCEMLEQAETDALRLSRFVDNLLQMMRLEAGALRPVLEPIDLSDVIGSALKRLERTLAGHVVRVRTEDPLPMLMLDFVLMEQVIANLLDNAARYSPPGTAIDIAAARLGDAVLLTVCDEGPGIPATDVERVFERFFRGDAGDGRPTGLGLGLAICRGFVEAMGGKIVAASRTSGQGAVFTVSLPVAAAESK